MFRKPPVILKNFTKAGMNVKNLAAYYNRGGQVTQVFYTVFLYCFEVFYTLNCIRSNVVQQFNM
jgi:hypothetical protein